MGKEGRDGKKRKRWTKKKGIGNERRNRKRGGARRDSPLPPKHIITPQGEDDSRGPRGELSRHPRPG